MRCALRPPSTSPASTPTNGHQHRQHQQQSAGCRHVSRRQRRYASPASGSTSRRRVGGERDRAGRVVQPQQQRDGERGRGEGDDDGGDQQRLRHRIAAEPGRRRRAGRWRRSSRKTPLPTTLKARILRSGCGFTIRPYRPEADQHRRAQPEQRRRVHRRCAARLRRAGEQQRRGSARASASARASMTTISGFASPSG